MRGLAARMGEAAGASVSWPWWACRSGSSGWRPRPRWPSASRASSRACVPTCSRRRRIPGPRKPHDRRALPDRLPGERQRERVASRQRAREARAHGGPGAARRLHALPEAALRGPPGGVAARRDEPRPAAPPGGGGGLSAVLLGPFRGRDLGRVLGGAPEAGASAPHGQPRCRVAGVDDALSGSLRAALEDPSAPRGGRPVHHLSRALRSHRPRRKVVALAAHSRRHLGAAAPAPHGRRRGTRDPGALRIRAQPAALRHHDAARSLGADLRVPPLRRNEPRRLAGGRGRSAGGRRRPGLVEGPVSDPIVRVSCVRHTYPDRTEVHLCGLDFEVDRGQRVVVLGPNGCGKTTLLFHILGLLEPEEGEVSVFGVNPARHFNRIRERVGVLFQNVDEQIIAPTVWDDVSFSPRSYGYSDAEVDRMVERALERVDIAHLRHKVCHYLSGGEKRKVALAGALVLEPELLVLDGPFEGLDPASRTDLRALLNRLHSERRVTLVMATLYVNVVAAMADRVYVLLRGGEIVARGTPQDVFQDPGLLRRSNIEPPVLAELFQRLAELGAHLGRPLTVEDAARVLVEWGGRARTGAAAADAAAREPEVPQASTPAGGVRRLPPETATPRREP